MAVNPNRLREVRRIGVFPPSAVGDFAFSLPALHALRTAYRDAELVYLGQPWHADFLDQRPGPVDRVVVVPPIPGITLPPSAGSDTARIGEFISQMRDECFDLRCPHDVSFVADVAFADVAALAIDLYRNSCTHL